MRRKMRRAPKGPRLASKQGRTTRTRAGIGGYNWTASNEKKLPCKHGTGTSEAKDEAQVAISQFKTKDGTRNFVSSLAPESFVVIAPEAARPSPFALAFRGAILVKLGLQSKCIRKKTNFIFKNRNSLSCPLQEASKRPGQPLNKKQAMLISVYRVFRL